MTKGSAISILYVLAGELIALAFNLKMRTICIHLAHLPGGHRSGLYWSVKYASLQLFRPCSTLMVKATKKIIKKFTKATHGHPLFTKILFENLTFFTQRNGITRWRWRAVSNDLKARSQKFKGKLKRIIKERSSGKTTKWWRIYSRIPAILGEWTRLFTTDSTTTVLPFPDWPRII